MIKKGSYAYICNINNYWMDVIQQNEEYNTTKSEKTGTNNNSKSF